MRNKVAKKLRKQAFGDNSTKASDRKYTTSIKKKQIGGFTKENKPIFVNKETIYCTGDRATYQDLKKDYYKGE